jgi:hypothetical protein
VLARRLSPLLQQPLTICQASGQRRRDDWESIVPGSFAADFRHARTVADRASLHTRSRDGRGFDHLLQVESLSVCFY